MTQAQKERDVEKPFLLFMFFISASFTYGALLVYPLYQAVAASKGQEEVDNVQGGIILMGAKYASILTHNLLSRCWTSLRGLQLQVSCYLVFSSVCLCIAACDVVPEAATLIAVSSLYFTNSNVIAGPLWPVPSEERSKVRMLFYYACCPAGCLWTALASMCLAREEYRNNWGLRSAVIILPLCVTLVSWLMLPPDGFWSSERMRQKQLEREQEMAEEQRQLEEKRQKKEQAKQKKQTIETKKIEEEPDDLDRFGEEEPEKEEQEEQAESTEPNSRKAREELENYAAKGMDAKDGSLTETKPSLRTLTYEAPPLPPEVNSPLSGTRSPASPEGPMSPLGGLYKQAARMSVLAPPFEGLPALPRLSAAARASQKRQRRRSRQSQQSQRNSRFSASSRESRPTRRRSTMEQVRGTFKDRKTVITRMSFYTPLNPVLQRELGSIAGTDRASVFPGRLSDADSAFEEEPQQSPWRNGRFRVLVGTQCASLYCVTFWGYSVFPMLINEQGPSLELISFMYSVEGAAQVLCTILLMPFLDSRIFLKYFSTAFLLLASAPITVCFLGKIHWFFYLLCLLMVDVLLCVCNALLSVVVLRSLPWDQIMVFYNIACTLGGVLSGTSFVQMPLKALVGSWEMASVIGHGVPFVLLLLLFATHIQAMKELWDLLLEPVRRTELGDWDPDDLEEDELEDPEEGQEPPSLLTDKADKADKEKGESWLE